LVAREWPFTNTPKKHKVAIQISTKAALDCIAVLAFFTAGTARARGRLGFPTCVRIHTDLAANLLQEKRKGDDR
jgi:hypothetical protein